MSDQLGRATSSTITSPTSRDVACLTNLGAHYPTEKTGWLDGELGVVQGQQNRQALDRWEAQNLRVAGEAGNPRRGLRQFMTAPTYATNAQIDEAVLEMKPNKI